MLGEEGTHKRCSPMESYTWIAQCWPTDKNLLIISVQKVGAVQTIYQEQWPIGTDGEKCQWNPCCWYTLMIMMTIFGWEENQIFIKESLIYGANVHRYEEIQY